MLISLIPSFPLLFTPSPLPFSETVSVKQAQVR